MPEPNTKKKKNTARTTVPAASEKIGARRNFRLGIGVALLLTGAFTTLSVISYFFTWQTDQDKLLSGKDMWAFLKDSDSIITNWGGRTGALLSHTLVYRCVGVPSLAIGLWISLWGLYLVYDRKLNRLSAYLRWVCLLLLLTGPVLAYLWPSSPFPWGGAWGNESIAYLNGLIGNMGTGLGLFALITFLAFALFSLDIRPAISKARRRAAEMRTGLTEALLNRNEEHTPAPVPHTAPAREQQVSAADLQSGATADTSEELQNHTPAEPEDAPVPEEEILPEEDEENLQLTDPERSKQETLPATDTELSFEVITQPEEQPAAAIQHGAHITVQSNEPYAPELDLPNYKFPSLDLLEERSQESIALDKEELEKNKTQIIQTLKSFGIEIQRISATVGPTVTLYEIVPAEGVRISKIRNLEDDIALNLAALGIRIIAPIPGRGTIGIEVPNANKQIVSMRALLSSDKFVNNKMSLPIALGKKIDNDNYIVDLATMPHLLMAGATGQGKSVGINAVLVSLLYKKHPSQLKFVLVDPKKVELSIYKVIEKHFLAKLPNEEEAIITDTKKVINTLNALCIEMDNRYELLKEAGTRNIREYNEKFISRRLNPEKGHKYLPFIVLVVDEFADLIMTAGKEVEMPIARLAQLARAVGIHLIVATQRPSVNVITGTIKANFPARIAFKVSAKVDSRTILDSGGAEQLVGRGDMLISHGSELLRLQCAFVDTPEVEQIVEFIGAQRGYPYAFELPEYEGDDTGSGKVLDIGNRDELFEECARMVVQSQSGSTSNLQRRFNLGYNRAGRIMDQIEAAGIVGPAAGSKPREVYVKTEAELEAYL